MSDNEEVNVQEEAPEGIIDRKIVTEMKASYIDYSMSVIVSRALPDVRDGLKPVHRRIIYAMNESGMQPNKPYKKSARIVGDVLGKYHPHGDSAVYDSLVRMAQDFSLRYPLVDGQGNFGSVDGDSAAAMRYTESRMTKPAVEMVSDIDKATVDFQPNYDGSLKEPTVLPSKLPNLLINGSSGIAVGMATNIPPHNLNEVLDAAMSLIDADHEGRIDEVEATDLMEYIKGPDFPTGGTIYGIMGVYDAYRTGRGKVIVRAKTHLEEKKGGKRAIIITELPYMVNKAKLLEAIADHVRNKKIEGISDLRDESDRDGMRVVIELKRDATEEVVLKNLYKQTSMQTTFGVNNLALVDGRPYVLDLKKMLWEYVEHRRDVVRRRTAYDLEKAKERAHILEGLIKALDNIDRIIEIIRKSQDTEQASNALQSEFQLSNKQSKAILDMRLARLTGLEMDKLKHEYREIMDLIAELESILANPEKLDGIILDEMKELKETYGDERRTDIDENPVDLDLDIEDLLEVQEIIVTITDTGYIKRTSLDTYRAQRRGGKGLIGIKTKEEDFVVDMFVTSTHDFILFFTNLGKVYWLKGWRVPEGSRTAKGRAIINLLPELEEGEMVTAAIPVHEFTEHENVVFSTKRGMIKKTPLCKYGRPRRKGIYAINIMEGDELIEVRITGGRNDIMLATMFGQAVRFCEKHVRPTGRRTRGVRGIRLRQGDAVVSMAILEPDPDEVFDEDDLSGQVCDTDDEEEEETMVEEPDVEEEEDDLEDDDLFESDDSSDFLGGYPQSDEEGVCEPEGEKVLSITENGFGKRSLVHKYRKTKRGGLGVRTIITNERNGNVIKVMKVELDDQIICSTVSGMIIRIPIKEIPIKGRSTMGVRIMRLKDEDRLAAVAKTKAEDDDEEYDEEEGQPEIEGEEIIAEEEIAEEEQ